MFASQLTSNYDEKKKSPHEIRKLPAISQSPRNDIAQRFDQSLWYGSRISSCLCILSTMCPEN